MQEYLDFELKLEHRSGDEYAVTASSPDAGEVAGRFVVPFSEKELDDIEDILDIVLKRSVRGKGDAKSELEQVREFGKKLYGALVRDEVDNFYAQCYATARGQGKGVRVKLRLHSSLARLPWEFLYDARPPVPDFVALSTTTPLVRYVEMPREIAPLRIAPPLRILVVIAAPIGYAALDVEEEREHITAALDKLRQRNGMEVQVDFLEGPDTLGQLMQRRRARAYHVLHFIGHGDYNEKLQQGVLLLEDEKCRGRQVSGQGLVRLLRGHDSLRLVVINACKGALTSETNQFAGVAETVVGAGIPAVAAMQFAISDEAAITFTREFYAALADNYPVDAAMTEARLAIANARPDSIEWATPVLFMRARDGRLFDLVRKDAAGAPATTPLYERRQTQPVYDAAAYYRGLASFLEREWRGAKKHFEQVTEGDPNYEDARNKLEEVRREIKQQERLAGLYDGARDLCDEQKWAVVIKLFEEIQGIDPVYPDPEGLLVAALYGQAQAYIAVQKWEHAEGWLERVCELAPDYQYASDALALVRDKIAKRKAAALYTEAVKLVQDEQWQAALDKLAAAREVVADYPDAEDVEEIARKRSGIGLPKRIVWEKDGKEMVLVPAGEFIMGSDDGHKGYLDAYYIDRYPVTNAEYKKFVEVRGHRQPDYWKNGAYPRGEANYSIRFGWSEAVAYASWVGKRLPTEIEWRKALQIISKTTNMEWVEACKVTTQKTLDENSKTVCISTVNTESGDYKTFKFLIDLNTYVDGLGFRCAVSPDSLLKGLFRISTDKIICPECGAANPQEQIFCDNCGSRLIEPPPSAPNSSFCPECGAANPQEQIFCDSCGSSLI